MDATVDKTHQVIRLELERAHDMFEMPQSDLFSEFRNFMTGVEFCVSELRGHNSRKPVRVEIQLPPAEVSDGLDERISRTLRRYCDHRVKYSERERRAVRFDGFTSLWFGIPIALVGLAATVYSTRMESDEETLKVVLEHLGWVLAWVGLWFPADMIFFYGHPYTREMRALNLLRDAEIVVIARDLAEPFLP